MMAKIFQSKSFDLLTLSSGKKQYKNYGIQLLWLRYERYANKKMSQITNLAHWAPRVVLSEEIARR